MICAYNNCLKKAKYFMSWVNIAGRHEGLVCATHDKRLGRQNLKLYAGMTVAEAIKFEKEKEE